MVRFTEYADRDVIRELWRLRFGDTEKFTDWFFNERFSPAHSVVALEGGRVVSSVQSFPFHVRIRGTVLPCAVIAGVSTFPEFEGQGYMGRAMRYYMNNIAQRGGVVIPYRPENLRTFKSRGHFPVSTTAYFSAAEPGLTLAAYGGGLPEVVPLDPKLCESALHSCYYNFSLRYSGIISRSLADMRLKISDYLSSDASIIGVPDGDALRGYCIYSGDGDIYAEEFTANDPESERALMFALCGVAAARGAALRGKLPPDTGINLPGVVIQRRPMGVMGAGDIRELLRAVFGAREFRVAVCDATVGQNNGVFDFRGARVDGAPHLKLDAGRLVQFAVGYRTLSDLARAGQAEVSDPGAVRELDSAFPSQDCYTFDEY